MDSATAERTLSQFPEYTWLTGNKQLWWTTGEIARGMAVSPNTVLNWVKNGAFAGSVNLEGTWRIPRSSILLYLAERITPGPTNQQME